MRRVTCPHCGVSIPAERFRDGEECVPEFLTCNVCNKLIELPNHNGSDKEGSFHKILEKINQVDDGTMGDL
jgi:hypothetical protein